MSASHDDWDRDERDALAGLDDALAVVRERHRQDPTPDQLRAARAGVLPPDVQSAVDAHLRDSAWSRTLLEGLEPDATTLDATALDSEAEARLLARIQREAMRTSVEARATRWRLPIWFGPALVASAVAAWFVVRPGVSPVITPQPEATVAVAEPTPASPPFLLPFETPVVRLSPDALVWRGARGESAFLADIRPALDAYRQRDYATADRELASMATRYPQLVDVAFYQGMTALLTHDPRRAIAAFELVERSGDATFVADARWYRAVAEQHAGNAGEARERLDALCREVRDAGPKASARACVALTQLDAAAPPSSAPPPPAPR